MVSELEHMSGGLMAIKRLRAINLGLLALQPLSAGFWLSGFEHSSAIHAFVALALQLVAFIQGITAVALWRRRRVSARLAALCVCLFAMVFLEAWAGRKGEYWLHLPMGVGILVWMVRRMDRVDML